MSRRRSHCGIPVCARWNATPAQCLRWEHFAAPIVPSLQIPSSPSRSHLSFRLPVALAVSMDAPAESAPAPATAQPWQRADQTWRAQEPALGVFRHPKAFMFSPSAGRIAGESDEETSDGDEFPVLVLGKQARAMAPDPLHILGVHQPKPKPPRVIADRRYRIAFQAGHGSFPRPGYLERNLGTDATKEYAVRRSRSQLRTCCGLGYVLFLPFAFVLLVVNALARCHWRYWCGCEHPCCERCDRLCCAHARESARLRAGVGATGGEEGGGHQRARHDHRARDITLEDLEYAQEADVS